MLVSESQKSQQALCGPCCQWTVEKSLGDGSRMYLLCTPSQECCRKREEVENFLFSSTHRCLLVGVGQRNQQGIPCVWSCDNTPNPQPPPPPPPLCCTMRTHTSPPILFPTNHMTTVLPTGVFWSPSHSRLTHPHKGTPNTLTLSHCQRSMGKGGDMTIVCSCCGLCAPHLLPSAQGAKHRPMTGNPGVTSALARRDLGLHSREIKQAADIVCRSLRT